MSDTKPNFSPLALDILRDRYLWRDAEGDITETPEQLLRRVANHVAGAEQTQADREKYAELFYDLMARLDFLPNSPTLMNAGRPAPHGQLSACFVVGIEDSMESICEALRKQMLIHKTGGGTGFNFSKLRPKNSTVNSTNGKASGPVSFMRLFDLSTDVVQQGGMRRGANMAILSVSHPDIREFISCKDAEGVITNFNLSVGIPDAFMEKALTSKDSSERQLLWEIAEHAWKTGDPGIIFMDTLNENNPCPQLGRIEGTNPCVTGDTPILTDKGYRRIKDCVGEGIFVWNGESFSGVVPRVTGENQEVMTLTFSDGSELTCTPYHNFFIQEGFAQRGKQKKIEARELKIGDRLCKTHYPLVEGTERSMTPSEAYVNGFFSGDGTVCTDGHKQLRLYDKKRALVDFFAQYGSIGDRERDPINVSLGRMKNLRPKFWIPNNEVLDNRLAWLAGLVDADGHRNSADGSISIASIHRDFLLDIRLMLNTCGVPSSVLPLSNARETLLPDGKGDKKLYPCQECYRLIISAAHIKKLMAMGFKTKRVDLTDIRPNRNAGRFVKVVRIERKGEIADKVYCFNEPHRHAGMFNGILTGNCSEAGILANEACNLGSINLAHMVTPRGTFDWGRLRDTVILAVRFLDDVIDVNQYPLPEIDAAVKRTRKIGLGVMGWADLLYKLRIPYDSQEAVKLAGEIMEHIQALGHLQSGELGIQRGIPEACFHLRRRNATVTCIAPTGTIALLANCSSGIEPIFSNHYTRKVRLNDGTIVDKDMFSDAYMELVNDMTVSDEDVERIAKTAYTVSPEYHLYHTAAFQRYTDLGVSKTINMPAETTVEDVFNVYVAAWRQHLKGVTIYRNGSRGSQVLTESALPPVRCTNC